MAYDPSKSRGFEGIRDAKRGYSSNPLQEGKVVARIDGCEMFETANGETWKNTLTVLAVDAGPHRPGEVVNTFFSLKPGAKGKTIFQQNVKGFVAGVLDVPDSAVADGECLRCLEESNPLRGHVVVVTTTMRQSKETKDPKTGEYVWYPVHSWSRMMTPEEITAAIGPDGVARFFQNGL